MKTPKKCFAYDFLIYLAIISKMLLLQSDSKLLDWSILSNPNNIWLMIHVWKNTASPFFFGWDGKDALKSRTESVSDNLLQIQLQCPVAQRLRDSAYFRQLCLSIWVCGPEANTSGREY